MDFGANDEIGGKLAKNGTISKMAQEWVFANFLGHFLHARDEAKIHFSVIFPTYQGQRDGNPGPIKRAQSERQLLFGRLQKVLSVNAPITHISGTQSTVARVRLQPVLLS